MAQSIIQKRVQQLEDVRAEIKKEKDPVKLKKLKDLELEIEQSILILSVI